MEKHMRERERKASLDIKGCWWERKWVGIY